MEVEEDVSQQLQQATDTAATLQDRLRQTVDGEQQIQQQLDKMKSETKYHDSKKTASDITGIILLYYITDMLTLLILLLLLFITLLVVEKGSIAVSMFFVYVCRYVTSQIPDVRT